MCKFGFHKAKNYQNLTAESGSKQRCIVCFRKNSHSGSMPEDSDS